MLKYITVLCLLAALCAGAPQNPQDVQILRFDSDVQPDGYSFALKGVDVAVQSERDPLALELQGHVKEHGYETSDGTKRQEEGKIENPDSENAALTVTGEYAYVAPDGKTYTVTFTAGPNGFQPKTSLGQKK